MVKVYANLVRNGRRTLEDVPERYRAEVAEMLGTSEESGEGDK